METQTLDLEEKLEELRERQREVREAARGVERGTDRAQELESEYEALKGRITAFENALDNWGDGTFVVKELDYGELMRAKDEVQARSYELDRDTGEMDGVYRDGYYRIKVLQLAVVDSPEAAPDDPKDYPYRVGEWLYEAIDNLNTVGEVEVKNSSLWDDVEEQEGSTPSNE